MVKGITDAPGKLNRLGKIRLGVKEKKGDTTYPKATPYFVVNPDSSTPKESAKNFKEVYGDCPTTLDILLPYNDLNAAFPQSLKMFGTKGLICVGDGETARRLDAKTGEIIETKCCSTDCTNYKAKKCRLNATLNVVLYKVKGLGIWQIDTCSYYSIVSINNTLKLIYNMAGKLTGIPFKLSLIPKSVVDKETSQKRTIYILDLQTPYSLVDIMNAKQKSEIFTSTLPSSGTSTTTDDKEKTDKEKVSIDNGDIVEEEIIGDEGEELTEDMLLEDLDDDDLPLPF